MGIRDSAELALQDWLGSAGFDRGVDDPAGEDFWARQWATAYVDFAAGEKRRWLHGHGRALVPARRLGRARRWTWPTGTATRCRGSTSPGAPGRACSRRSSAGCAPPPTRGPRRAAVPAPGRRAERHRRRGRRRARRRARTVRRRAGRAPAPGPRRASSSCARRPSSSPPAASAATTTWSGRTGRTGSAPRPSSMISGVPAHVDGRMLGIAEAAGGRVVNRGPDVALHRGRAQLGPGLGPARRPDPARAVVAVVRRPRPAAAGPAASPASTPWHARATITTVATTTPGSCSPETIEKEFALSGSEQNPDLTGKDLRATAGPDPARGAGAGDRVPRPGRRLRRGRHAGRAGRRDERAHRRAAARPRPSCSARSSPATASWPPLRQGPAGRGDPGGPSLPRRPAVRGLRLRTGSSIHGTAR